MPGINDEESYEEGGYPMLFDENNTWGRNRKEPERPKEESSDGGDTVILLFGVFVAGIAFLGTANIAAQFLPSPSEQITEISCVVSLIIGGISLFVCSAFVSWIRRKLG